MQKYLSLCALSLISSLAFGHPEFKVHHSLNSLVIPASTKSCKALRNRSEEFDIHPVYVNIRNLEFNWSNTKQPLQILKVELKLPRNGPLSAYHCTVEGKDLLALNTNWYNGSNWQALLEKARSPELPSNAKMDCALSCGGIGLGDLLSRRGELQVTALTEDSFLGGSRLVYSRTPFEVKTIK